MRRGDEENSIVSPLFQTHSSFAFIYNVSNLKCMVPPEINGGKSKNLVGKLRRTHFSRLPNRCFSFFVVKFIMGCFMSDCWKTCFLWFVMCRYFFRLFLIYERIRFSLVLSRFYQAFTLFSFVPFKLPVFPPTKTSLAALARVERRFFQAVRLYLEKLSPDLLLSASDRN